MAVDTGDRVLAQLRKLREGRGLTPARLAAAGYVMGALATSDPNEAYERLLGLIERLGETDQAQAMKLDFGLDIARLLKREPVTREVSFLGDRRDAYKQVVSRDVKTVSRWSDAAIAELRTYLLSDQVGGDLYVVAAVEDDRILAINVTTSEPGQAEKYLTTTTLNHSDGKSLPGLFYAFPRDWRPTSLTLAAVFRGDGAPTEGIAFAADSFLALSFAGRPTRVALNGDTLTCRFPKPTRSKIYAMCWNT